MTCKFALTKSITEKTSTQKVLLKIIFIYMESIICTRTTYTIMGNVTEPNMESVRKLVYTESIY